MAWRDQNVLITGCTGFLGSWLTRDLVSNGANVVGLVRDAIPYSNLYRLGLHNHIRIVHGSVEDYSLLERTINEYEINTVFHLAAQTVVTIANRNPMSTFSSNILGTWNILEACRRNPIVTKVITASSDKAYGDQPELPYTEEMALRGSHPYDVSKSCADLLAFSYYNTYDLPVCVTRFGNLYGGGDLNFNRLVPSSIRSIYLEEKPIIRSDGNYKRDYIYVADAAQGYVLLAENMEAFGTVGEAFNFAGEPHSVINVVKKITEITNRIDLEPIILNEATGEIRNQYLSGEKVQRVLGWKPKHDLSSGLRKTVAWYQEFFKSSSVATNVDDEPR